MGLVAGLGSPSLAMSSEVREEATIRIGVVGATQADSGVWTAGPLLSEVEQWRPDLVILTGGYVRRGSRAGWSEFAQHWSAFGERLVVAPDDRARRGDRHLSRWQREAGRTVQDLPGATWAHVDVETKGTVWRLVVVDPSRDALGDRWLDQRSWLPKVVGGDDHARLLVVSAVPLASLSTPSADSGEAMSDLLAVITDHAAPTTLIAVISGGTRTNELLMHSGSFGEVHIVAGNGAVASGSLARRGHSDQHGVGAMSLVNGFDGALAEAWLERVGTEVGSHYDGNQMPLRGWWQLLLDGESLSVAFALEAADRTYDTAYRIRYDLAHGWVAED